MATVVVGAGSHAWQVRTFRPRRLVTDISAHYLIRRYA